MQFVCADETLLPAIEAMARACVAHMRSAGNDQWNDVYPSTEHFRADWGAANLFVLIDAAGGLIGCATLDQRQAPEYAGVRWMYPEEPIAVVHRLMIAPPHMGKGMAKLLIGHLEDEARLRKCRTLRVDTYFKNLPAARLYGALGYRRAGEVQFPFRPGHFPCFEKQLDSNPPAIAE